MSEKLKRIPPFWAHRAKRVMSERKLNIEDVAREIGVSKATYGHWLTGLRRPRVDQVQDVAKALGIKLADLVEGDPTFAASPDEQALLAAFKKMDQRDRNLLLAFAKAALERS